MKVKALALLFVCMTISIFGLSQEVEGQLFSAIDTVELKVIDIYPKEFPEISVIFEASDINNRPIWTLTPDVIEVTENGESCEIVELIQVSRDHPINLGIIIDHSGSMAMDEGKLYDSLGLPLFSRSSSGWIELPKDYKSPLTEAKEATMQLIRNLNTHKDSLMIVGFSTVVDTISRLTDEQVYLTRVTGDLKTSGLTAFYDAIDTGIVRLASHSGVKALIALTDGNDNTSGTEIPTLVKKAVEAKIPIFLVGLGDVNSEVLRTIAEDSKGAYYYTKDSKDLSFIYEQIQRRILSIYSLTYSSPNFSKKDTSRQVKIRFDVDSIYLKNDLLTYQLPEEAVAYIAQQEKERNYLIGGILFMCLALGGALVLYAKRPITPTLNNIYPNPSTGAVSVELGGSIGKDMELIVIDGSGKKVHAEKVAGTIVRMDLSTLSTGMYYVNIKKGDTIFMGKKVSIIK